MILWCSSIEHGMPTFSDEEPVLDRDGFLPPTWDLETALNVRFEPGKKYRITVEEMNG